MQTYLFGSENKIAYAVAFENGNNEDKFQNDKLLIGELFNQVAKFFDVIAKETNQIALDKIFEQPFKASDLKNLREIIRENCIIVPDVLVFDGENNLLTRTLNLYKTNISSNQIPLPLSVCEMKSCSQMTDAELNSLGFKKHYKILLISEHASDRLRVYTRRLTMQSKNKIEE